MRCFRWCSLAVLAAVQAVATPFTIPSDRSRALLDGGDPISPTWFRNPAALPYIGTPALECTVVSRDDAEQWGLATALPGLGFSAAYERGAQGEIADYRVGAGFGNRGWNIGCAYGWSLGETGAYRRSELAEIGLLLRTGRLLSLGMTGIAALRIQEFQGIIDLGLRPFRTASLTLSGRYAHTHAENASRSEWSTGIAAEILRGLWLTAEVRDTGEVRLGTQLGFGGIALGARALMGGARDDRMRGTGSLMLRGWDRSILDRRSKFVVLDLRGPIAYRPRFLLDRETRVLSQVLDAIEAARTNETVAGAVVNTSGMQADIATAWELRERLAALRAAGKKVVVYLDEAGIVPWYLTSAADRVVMHPLGVLDIRGVSVGRFYVKNALDKLGIGFEEVRYRRYKSAAEPFTRDRMSDADREQWEAYLDGFYRRLRDEIAAARQLPPDHVDALIDEQKILTAAEARTVRLVDAVAVWESTDTLAGVCRREDLVQPLYLDLIRTPPERRWEPVPTVAVVYALGVCAMDYGINARRLAETLDSLAGNPLVSAVVVRVDSPGGSALASEVVADALRRCRESKPVVVSQGAVAASGGYWLSLYGDSILTTPFTVTGSIGVIYGWAYNRGFKEKLGVTTDRVKRGESSDLELGMPLPFLGMLPDRALTDDERKRLDAVMSSAYDAFLDRVAERRALDRNAVEAVAEGRIWSGADAVSKGLCDSLGGLYEAIQTAKESAGIPKDRPVHVVEFPAPELFPRQLPLGLDVAVRGAREASYALDLLRVRAHHNGKPLLMLADDVALPGR